jgi:cob(I)alamin adenosyltransferase
VLAYQLEMAKTHEIRLFPINQQLSTLLNTMATYENKHNLTEERAKLLVFCIETMKNEMDAKGFEFYENSVRSLGVSLFIQITRYLP